MTNQQFWMKMDQISASSKIQMEEKMVQAVIDRIKELYGVEIRPLIKNFHKSRQAWIKKEQHGNEH